MTRASEEVVSFVDAVIFDMDGLLVDTEPIWGRVQVDVLDSIGVDIRPLLGTGLITGMRADEAVSVFRNRLGFAGPSDKVLAEMIVDGVVSAIPAEARLVPGALEALDFCATNGLKLALASGSVASVIDAVLDRFALRERFAAVVSADRVQLGKPHPAVFLATAHDLDVDPMRCVVVEDALNGCIAAKAAQMLAIAVPELGMEGDPRWSIADLVLGSLGEFCGPAVSSLIGIGTSAVS